MTDADDIDFPVLSAIAREGRAVEGIGMPGPDDDLPPLFRAIVDTVPAPGGDPDGPLQAIVTNLDGIEQVRAERAHHVDLGHADRQGGVMALQHHAQRVADQQAFHAGLVHGLSEDGVVAGDHGEFFATLPGGGEDFVEMVLPELRRRGLFRSEYEGRTLRENLGLRPVVNRYTMAV
mgnify:CR=1 FL=1